MAVDGHSSRDGRQALETVTESVSVTGMMAGGINGDSETGIMKFITARIVDLQPLILDISELYRQ